MSEVLYRFWGESGELLYVGITATPWQRWKAHRYEKPWWEEVSTVTLETFATRVEVEEAERQAILSEDPLYNIAGRTPRKRKPKPVALHEPDRIGCVGSGCDDRSYPHSYWLMMSWDQMRSRATTHLIETEPDPAELLSGRYDGRDILVREMAWQAKIAALITRGMGVVNEAIALIEADGGGAALAGVALATMTGDDS